MNELIIKKENWLNEVCAVEAATAVEILNRGGWLEKNQDLVLSEGGEDYRDVFLKDFYEMFNPDFTEYLEKLPAPGINLEELWQENRIVLLKEALANAAHTKATVWCDMQNGEMWVEQGDVNYQEIYIVNIAEYQDVYPSDLVGVEDWVLGNIECFLEERGFNLCEEEYSEFDSVYNYLGEHVEKLDSELLKFYVEHYPEFEYDLTDLNECFEEATKI